MRGKHASDEGMDIDIPWKKLFIIIVLIAIIVGAIFGGKKLYPIIVSKGWLNFNKSSNTQTTAKTQVTKMPDYIDDYKVLGEIKFEKLNYSGYILDSEVKNLNSKSSTNTTNTSASTNTTAQNTTVASTNTTVESSITVENEDPAVVTQPEDATVPAEATPAQDAAVATKTEVTDLVKALDSGLVKLYGDKLNQKGNFVVMGHNKDKMFSILQGVSVGEEFSVVTNTKLEKKYKIIEVITVEPNDLKALMPNKDYTQITLITCASGSNKRLVVKALEVKDYQTMQAKKTASNTNTATTTNTVKTENVNTAVTNEVKENTSVGE